MFSDLQNIIETKQILDKNPLYLKYFPNKLKENEDLIKYAVCIDGFALEFASEVAKDDKNIVKLAIQSQPMAIKFASKNIKDDESIALFSIEKEPQTIQFFSILIRNNKLIILNAIKLNGLCLKYASVSLQKDKEVVLEAVKQNGLALRYAKYFQGDKLIVEQSILQNPSSIKYSNFRQDLKLATLAVQSSGHCIQYLSSELQENENLISLGLKSYPKLLKTILFPKPNQIIEACFNTPIALMYQSHCNINLIPMCIQKNGQNLIYTDYRGNFELIKIAVETYKNLNNYQNIDNPQKIEQLLKINWECFFSIKNKVQKNPYLVKILIQQQPYSIFALQDWKIEDVKQWVPHFDYNLLNKIQNESFQSRSLKNLIIFVNQNKIDCFFKNINSLFIN